ncbi:MAG: 4-hydroxy-tetrahydrodipicolinate synthase [Clostridia bacterium]|jgi:4-hydroxy-tetrahydrodipicolinate synthase|nr:4-hydroxy-tetrahydrodipicolinate synthase [Clostridia bacterium]MBT7123294.1 4-hydroxy-tetrahydrodipicolinate synthase [Clostridia bacterium]
MSIFSGAGTALVTPFNEKGIDYTAFEVLLDYQIKGGIDALVVCGTTGESSTMSKQEDLDAIAFVVKHADGRVPVIAGAGSNDTASAVEASKNASDLGADGILIVTPYYNKCNDTGLIRHYHAIADASGAPIIAYNVPSRTGVNIKPEVMREIAVHDNVAAIKEASGDISQIAQTCRLCPDIDVYSGNDDHVVPILSLGGTGVISVVSNVMPQMTHDMVASYLNGDVNTATALQHKLNPLIDALFSEVNPIPVKTALNMIGINAGLLRMPLCEMSESNAAKLKEELIAIGLKIV